MKAQNHKKLKSTTLALDVRRIRTNVRGGVDEYGQCSSEVSVAFPETAGVR